MAGRHRFEDRPLIHMTPYSNHIGFVDQWATFFGNILMSFYGHLLPGTFIL